MTAAPRPPTSRPLRSGEARTSRPLRSAEARTPRPLRAAFIAAFVGLAAACSPDAPPPDPDAGPRAATPGDAAPAAAAPQAAFWDALQALCGQAFAGQVVESVPPDPAFDEAPLVMHVRTCGEDEIRIPFHVGDDRSRTWVITRTADGLRLKHDHRHQDGSEDEVSRYGGDTTTPGTATTQDFAADAFTAELVPAAATNVWTVEVRPGEIFAYGLRREGSDRRFRAEFDLSSPLAEAPPPPWGG